MAERGGFEPPVRFNPYNGLANRRFRPLSHLSVIDYQYFTQAPTDSVELHVDYSWASRFEPCPSGTSQNERRPGSQPRSPNLVLLLEFGIYFGRVKPKGAKFAASASPALSQSAQARFQILRRREDKAAFTEKRILSGKARGSCFSMDLIAPSAASATSANASLASTPGNPARSAVCIKCRPLISSNRTICHPQYFVSFVLFVVKKFCRK